MNALRSIAKVAPKVAAPATRRAASGSAKDPAFKSLWMPAEVYPIIGVIVGGGVLVSGILSRNSLDTTWTKTNRSKGVAIWYERKYPGVDQEAKSGARAAHAH